MVQLFLDGGNFMWPILGIGIIGLIFVFERLFHLISGLGANESFSMQVAHTTREEGFDAGLSQCNTSVGPVANLCYNALEVADQGTDAVEKKLSQTAGIEMASLEKNMTWISLCIATAPMLGFLGTEQPTNKIDASIIVANIFMLLLTLLTNIKEINMFFSRFYFY